MCYNSGDIEFFLGDCFLLSHRVDEDGHGNDWQASSAAAGLVIDIDLGVTRTSFCGSARKFCSWLAGSSLKKRLRFSNVSSIGLSVRSSSC